MRTTDTTAPATVTVTLVRGATYHLAGLIFEKETPMVVPAEIAEHLRHHAVDYGTIPDCDPTPDDPADRAFPRRVTFQKFRFEPGPAPVS